MKTQTITLFLFLVISLTSFSQENRTNLPLNNRLQIALEKKSAEKKVKGISATIYFKDGTSWNGVYGNSNDSVKIDSTTLFGIGSITKNFTAAIILQLIEEGKLNLQDSISDYLSAYDNIDGTITIQQLLNHTSGLYNYTTNPNIWDVALTDMNTAWNHGDQLKFVENPYFEQGTAWSYSNTNFVLLGLIIEKITGNPLKTELHKRIMDPLGLSNTYLFPDENYKGNMSEAWQYSSNKYENISWYIKTPAYFSIAWSSGAIVSTANDLAKYLFKINNGQILNISSRQQMQTGCTKNNGYGLGTMINNLSRNGHIIKCYGHGGVIGFMSAGYYIPTDSISIAVVCNQNTDPFVDGFTGTLYSAFLNEAPTDINFSLTNKTSDSLLIGTFETEDINKHGQGIFTYSFATADGIKDADNSYFTITKNNLLRKGNIEKRKYSLFIKSEDGFGGEISKTFTIDYDGIKTSRQLELENSLSIFPNPVKDIINIQSDDAIQKIELRNLAGKLILQHQASYDHQMTFNIGSYLQPGIYLLTITGERTTTNKRIFVQ